MSMFPLILVLGGYLSAAVTLVGIMMAHYKYRHPRYWLNPGMCY